jgi:protein-tyrosine phosphatase
MGCLVQVTAQSYTGGFGSQARKFAEMLLDAGSVHFFATDAHDTVRRPPLLSACYRKVAKAKGEEIADLLLRKNPEAVINGLPLPPQPEDSEDRHPDEEKRSWFSFLWGR